MFSADLQIALILVVVVVVVFVASRIGVLPKKNIPLVLGAFAAVFGWVIFRDRRTRALKKELTDLEDRLKTRKKEVERLKTDFNASERQTDEARATLERQAAAMQKELLLINADNAARKKEIDSMEPAKLREEFRKAFANP